MARGVRGTVRLPPRIGAAWLCALLRMPRGPEEFTVSEKDWDFALEGQGGKLLDSQRWIGWLFSPTCDYKIGRAGPSRADGFGKGSLLRTTRLLKDLLPACSIIRLLALSVMSQQPPCSPHLRGREAIGTVSGALCLDIRMLQLPTLPLTFMGGIPSLGPCRL